MALFKGDRKLTLFKGDRKPFAIYKGDKQITGAVKTHLEGTDIVKWESPYKAEIPNVETEGLGKQDKLSGKNLFDIGKITNVKYDVGSLERNDDELVIVTDVGGRGIGIREKLKDILPYIKINEIYTLNFLSDGKPYICLTGSGYTWFRNTSHTITTEELEDGVYFYGKGNNEPCIISNIQIEQGTQATEYEPYCGGIPAPNPQYPIEPKFNSGNRFKINTPPQEVDIPILRALPNTEFKDTYDAQRGIITRRVEEIVFTPKLIENMSFDFGFPYFVGSFLQPYLYPNYSSAGIFSHGRYYYVVSNPTEYGAMLMTDRLLRFYVGLNDLESNKAFCLEQYNKGIPLKIWYALKTPYAEKVSTTPLRQDWNGQLMQTGGDCGYAPMRADVFTEFRG